MRRRLLFSPLLALALLAASPGSAADFAAGVDAYDRGDYAAAFAAWLPLAQGGDPAAQRNVGHLFRFGLGTPQDFGRAAYWYREAAEAGLAAAQTNLGVMYLRGQGMAEAPERAAYWFQRAASQGHAVAQYNLGVMFLAGNGVPKSEGRALGWFNLAAKSGHERALEALSRLTMAAARRAEAPSPEAAGADDDSRPTAARPQSAQPAAAPATAQEEARPLPVPAIYARREGDQQRLVAAMTALLRGDPAAAEAGFRPLARAGMAEAQYQLGMLLDLPGYAGRDPAEAFAWLALAEERGHTLAAPARQALLPRLSAEQLSRGERLLLARRGQS